MWFKRKKTIQINYKSGQTIFVKAKEFVIKFERNNENIKEISWKNIYPNPFYMNIDQIESIWVL